MASFMFRDEGWPLVYCAHSGLYASLDEVDVFLAGLEELYARKQPFVILNDLSQGGKRDNEQLSRIGAWMKAHRDEIARYNKGTCFVSQSTLFRFVMSSLFLVQPLPNPYSVCASLDEAYLWIKKRLDDEGMRSAIGLEELLRHQAEASRMFKAA